MRRALLAVAVVLVALASHVVATPAGTAQPALRLIAGSDVKGWVSLTVHGPDSGSVEVRELARAPGEIVTRLSLLGGTAQQPRAARWRCDRRPRRFFATTNGAGDARQTATATITTPSCARRLRMIVVPARLAPGKSVNVRVTDSWRLGGISANICASQPATAPRCERVRLAPGVGTRRARLRLVAAGRRTIALRSPFGQRLTRQVEVRRDARLRILVTGDSMIFGLFETLAKDLGERALVRGDAHPGRGITTPGRFDWPAHARHSAATVRPDVTVAFVGAADGGYPIRAPTGSAVPCCGPAWVSEYARRVDAMMRAYLRGGRGLVYWVILPAPRSPLKARVFRAENEAIRQAAAGHDDGVHTVERLAELVSPDDQFHEMIALDGRERVVRDEDGVHLANSGIRLATNIFKERLRVDGLLEYPQR